MWYYSFKYTLDFGNDVCFSFIRQRKITVLKLRSSFLLSLHVESILYSQLILLHARSIKKRKGIIDFLVFIENSNKNNQYVFYKQK